MMLLHLCAGEYNGYQSIKAFSQYVIARYNYERQITLYKIYVTDTLKIIGANTAKSSGGSYFPHRWIDIVNPQEMDTRNGSEIAQEVIRRAGLKVKR